MSRKPVKHAPRQPQSVRGGIRAQSHRGAFARQWWGRRWMAVLESLQIGARLGRGRSYAYSGQVSALDIQPGRITAAVQGSGPTAYQAEIQCAVLSEPARSGLLAELRARQMLVARLLVRELPREVDELFRAAGHPLFPEPRGDLVTRCSCPDWANPCKHIAAVYFLLTEAFDHDPLLLLRLRGVGREDLLAPPGGDATRPVEATPAPPRETVSPAPLESAEQFWGAAPPPAAVDFGPAPAEGVTAPLARRLGPLPFWRGEERFLDTIATASGRAVQAGWRAWAGERPAPRQSGPAEIGGGLRLRTLRPRMDVMLR